MAHRLVLVLSTSDPGIAARLDADGWQWCWCEDADQIQADTQVVATRPGRLTGLWLRLAPITYLGGSIMGRGPSLSPQIPASLGSVVIHGSSFGPYAADLEPMRMGGATCMVRNADGLGDAVERFLNPAEAAQFARLHQEFREHLALLLCEAGASVVVDTTHAEAFRILAPALKVRLDEHSGQFQLFKGMASAYLTLTVQDEAGHRRPARRGQQSGCSPKPRQTSVPPSSRPRNRSWSAKGCGSSRQSCCGFSGSTFNFEKQAQERSS